MLVQMAASSAAQIASDAEDTVGRFGLRLSLAGEATILTSGPSWSLSWGGNTECDVSVLAGVKVYPQFTGRWVCVSMSGS